MKSVFDELSDKIKADPSLRKRSGPRQDLGLLLFAEREGIDRLWKAAKRLVREGGGDEELGRAVEALAPLFGERNS